MEVTLKVQGNMLGVFPTNKYIRQILEPIATAKVKTYEQKLTQRGMRSKVVIEDVPLFYIDDDILHVFSGLEHEISAALKKCGMQVQVDHLTDFTLKANLERLDDQDLSNLDEREDQVDVIGLVCDQPGGFIVEAPTGWGKSFAIVQICKILPTYNVAIIAPSVEIVKTIYKRLKAHIKPQDLGIVGDGNNRIRRVTVCTMQSMQKLRKTHWDLMMFDEVHRAGGRKTANDVAEVFSRTKCVGFSASPKGRSDNADKVVTALFGPVIYRVHYSEAEGRGSVVPIKVKMYRISHGHEQEQRNRDRYGLWNNTIRNEFIRDLVSELPDDEQILITVATAEHALNLRELLPDFEVVFKSATSKKAKRLLGQFEDVRKWCRKGKMLPDHVDYLRRQFESGELRRAIATQVWSTGVDFVQLKYLIRAEGTASKIQATQVPGRLSRTNQGQKDVGYLIDFIDEFDSNLGGRSQSRKRMYLSKGWDVEVISHPSVTIPRFNET